MWRLVVEKVARLEEIENSWSLGDVLDANEALDVWDDAQDPDLQPPDLPGGDRISIQVTVKNTRGPR